MTQATDILSAERIAEFRQYVIHTGLTKSEVQELLTSHDAQAAEIARLRRSFELIRNQGGKVCPEFEICKHESCMSSYASWAIADEALKGPADE